MFERWERCEATVVARQVRTASDGLEPDVDVVVDVARASGTSVRVTIYEVAYGPAVGDVVSVLYDDASGTARFDTDDPELMPATDPFEPVAAGAANGAGADAEATFFGRTPDVLATMHTPPGGIAADPGVRLAKLQALKEQGFLNDDEYREQRQNIIDTF
jgi:hypothetical protein